MSTVNTTNDTNASGNNKTFTDWNKWYEALPSSIKINQKLQEQLFQDFKGDITAVDCKKKLSDYQDTMFLFKETFGQRINIFHHIKYTGGTVYDRTVHTGFIQVTTKEEANPMTPDIPIEFHRAPRRTMPLIVRPGARLFTRFHYDSIRAYCVVYLSCRILFQ